jgi:hypothetical protein
MWWRCTTKFGCGVREHDGAVGSQDGCGGAVFFFVDYEECGCGAGDLNFARATVKSVALT